VNAGIKKVNRAIDIDEKWKIYIRIWHHPPRLWLDLPSKWEFTFLK